MLSRLLWLGESLNHFAEIEQGLIDFGSIFGGRRTRMLDAFGTRQIDQIEGGDQLLSVRFVPYTKSKVRVYKING